LIEFPEETLPCAEQERMDVEVVSVDEIMSDQLFDEETTARLELRFVGVRRAPSAMVEATVTVLDRRPRTPALLHRRDELDDDGLPHDTLLGDVADRRSVLDLRPCG